MTYTVKYKLKNQWFWRTIRKVKGDNIRLDIKDPYRIFTTEKELRYEIPMEGTCFWFSVGRFLMIKDVMEKEAGQPIKVNSKAA